jgi:hypothetical protein
MANFSFSVSEETSPARHSLRLMRTLLLPSYQGPVVDFRIARLSVRVMADREIPDTGSVGRNDDRRR